MFMPIPALPAGAGEANMSKRSADPEDGAASWGCGAAVGLAAEEAALNWLKSANP
jgi:hypothetical protein